MDIETACRHIQAHVERMRGVNSQPLFDEWALLGSSGKAGGVLAYRGPRADLFRRTVATDAEPLRARSSGKQFAEGDIEFAPDAAGTKYDAFLKTGPTSYLVLNHTAKTMAEIRTDPKWLTVQGTLFELSERFRADPLVIEAS